MKTLIPQQRRNPFTDPDPGDILLRRGTRVVVTKRGAYGVRGYTEGPGRSDGAFVANLQVWSQWFQDGQVLALGLPRGPLGVARLPINPASDRWHADPTDDRCDLCACDEAAFHDLLMCPHGACRWSIQVCEHCGGYAEGRTLLERHLGECLVAAKSELRYNRERHELVEPDRQLGLFGESR